MAHRISFPLELLSPHYAQKMREAGNFCGDWIEMSEHDYESETCSDDGSQTGSYASGTTEESFSSLAEALEAMREKLEQFHDGVEHLHTSVKTMEAPVTSVAVTSFSQPHYLKSAPFRSERFALQEQAKQILGIQKDSAKFSSICSKLRAYLFKHKLVDAQGIVHLNTELKEWLGCEDDTTTFLGLLLRCDAIMK